MAQGIYTEQIFVEAIEHILLASGGYSKARKKIVDESINYSLEKDRVKLESNQVSDQVNTLIINTLQDIDAFLNVLSQSDSDQVSNQVSNQVSKLLNKEFNNKLISILTYIKDEAKSRSEIFTHIELSNQYKNTMKYIDPLLEYDWIKYTIPENIKDRNQKYVLTKKGLFLLRILELKER